MTRNMIDELKVARFKPVTYGMYNELYDEMFIEHLKNKYDEVFSVDEIEYYDFPLDDTERMNLKIWSKEFNDEVVRLTKFVASIDEARLHVERDGGLIRVFKLSKHRF